MDNLESPERLMFVFLGCGMVPEISEETHVGMRGKFTFHVPKKSPGLDLNQGHWL